MWNLIFYKTDRGKCPTADFIRSLSPRLHAEALKDLDMLKEYGNQLTMPYSKSMGNGIFELRIQQSNNAARIFYFFQVGSQIILTNGFIKKTQKTPKQELEKALKYKQDYEKRVSK